MNIKTPHSWPVGVHAGWPFYMTLRIGMRMIGIAWRSEYQQQWGRTIIRVLHLRLWIG